MLSLILFTPFLLTASGYWLASLREGSDGDILYRVEYPKVSHSLHDVWLGLCICSHLLQENASLTMAEKGTDYICLSGSELPRST